MRGALALVLLFGCTSLVAANYAPTVALACQVRRPGARAREAPGGDVAALSTPASSAEARGESRVRAKLCHLSTGEGARAPGCPGPRRVIAEPDVSCRTFAAPHANVAHDVPARFDFSTEKMRPTA